MKKFFDVNIGNEQRNEGMYKFLMQNGFIGTTSVAPASEAVVAAISELNGVDLTNVNVFKATINTGEAVFIAERTRTNTVDVTYQEFQEWLEEENLVEDLDMGYSDYLEENNLTPNEQNVVYYAYELFDYKNLLADKLARITRIEKEMKILEILKMEYEELKTLFS